jgi:hypothetical protein
MYSRTSSGNMFAVGGTACAVCARLLCASRQETDSSGVMNTHAYFKYIVYFSRINYTYSWVCVFAQRYFVHLHICKLVLYIYICVYRENRGLISAFASTRVGGDCYPFTALPRKAQCCNSTATGHCYSQIKQRRDHCHYNYDQAIYPRDLCCCAVCMHTCSMRVVAKSKSWLLVSSGSNLYALLVVTVLTLVLSSHTCTHKMCFKSKW